MSTKQHHNDSSLTNEPERDANKLANARISSGSTGAEGSIESYTEKNNAPIDKQGDTLGGGISFQNKEFK
jgi:hypothetical protein